MNAQVKSKAPTYLELDITLHRGNCSSEAIDLATPELTFKTGEVFVVCYTATAPGYPYFIGEFAKNSKSGAGVC